MSYIRDRELLEGTSIRGGKPVLEEHWANVSTAITFDSRTALIVQMIDRIEEKLVMFITLQAVNSAESPTPVEVSRALTQYAIETKSIHVRGEPDWAFWTRPYEHAYHMYEGAGRYLGPASIGDVDFAGEVNLKNLGFVRIKESHPGPESRVVGAINHRKFIREGVLNSRLFPDGIVLPSESREEVFRHLNTLYAAVTGQPGPFQSDRLRDWEGYVAIIDANHEYMYMFEAESTPEPLVYRLDGKILVLDPEIGGPQPADNRDGPLRVYLHCSYDVEDESAVAFLVPINGDSYLVVLAHFSLIQKSRTPFPDARSRKQE
jgi:hypothetical protein